LRKLLNFGFSTFFLGDSQIFGLTFKASPIFSHLAKFHSDRSKELADLGPKCKKAVASKKNLGSLLQFWCLHYPSAHASNHVWKFHGNQPRNLGDMAFQSARKK